MKAVEWYRKAAAQNHPGALYKLGEYTERGLGGMTMDPDKAADYYQRAADRGDKGAQEALARLKGGKTTPPVTPPEVPAPAEPEQPAQEEKKKGGFFKKFFGN